MGSIVSIRTEIMLFIFESQEYSTEVAHSSYSITSDPLNKCVEWQCMRKLEIRGGNSTGNNHSYESITSGNSGESLGGGKQMARK